MRGLMRVPILAAMGASILMVSAHGRAVGSSSAIPRSDLASLAQIVKKGERTITRWPGPKSGPIAHAGKFLVSIPCARVAYGCARIDDGVRAASKVLGWRVLSIDPAGDPAKANAAVRQAISLHASGIVVGALDPALLKNAIAAARAAGIPVVDPVAARPVSATGINHDIKIHGYTEGQVLGAYIAIASGGKAHVGIMDDKEFPHQALRTGGLKNSLSRCGGCSVVGESDFVVTDIGTQLGPKSQSFLQANPSIDWLDVAFDAAASSVVIADQQSGARKVNIVSMDANPQNVAFIQQGKQNATVGAPLDWAGWAAVDNLNRIFNKQAPTRDDGIPLRLVTKDNVADFVKHGYGPVNYKAKYTQLWKTGHTS